MHRKFQPSLFEQNSKRGRKPTIPLGHFGGRYHQNYNPKEKRPIDSKKALHVVLKSSQAVGSKSFKKRKFEGKIWQCIADHAAKNDIKIYEYANAGNHLHILLRAKYRDDYRRFIRVITGLIARLVGGSERGRPLKRKFWDSRPYSRVVSFAAKEYRAIKKYLLRNTLEAIGWVKYVPRNQRLSQEVRRLFLPATE